MPLLPEHFLVLTYNVKAARELQDRLDKTVGTAARARMTVSNFHSFCQRILTENAADAGLPPRPDVLDGVGQVLLLKDILPVLPLIYHYRSAWALSGFVQFINRAKDELVTPDDFDAYVADERRVFEERYGSFDAAEERLAAQGNLQPLRKVRSDYAGLRTNERAEDRGETPNYDPEAASKTADREARRTIAGSGRALFRTQIDPETHPRIDALAATYETDGAALEILRLTELAAVFRAYEEELARRGALDFGEQIAAVTKLFKIRPNVLRRWQRQFRYLLIDEFQDANIAQIELIELLGRTPDRPDNVMVVGDDDQSIYRFRGASFAAFAEFDARFGRPPSARPDGAPARTARPTPDRAELPLGPPRADRRQPADRLQRDPLRARQATRHRASRRPAGRAAGVRRRRGRGRRDRRCHQVDGGGGDRRASGPMSPSCIASTGIARRSWRGCARRTSRTPWSVG